jgi:hypothetical protein
MLRPVGRHVKEGGIMTSVQAPGAGDAGQPGRGAVAAGRALWGYSVRRWRHGELGSLPVIVGLIAICGYFQSQQPPSCPPGTCPTSCCRSGRSGR